MYVYNICQLCEFLTDRRTICYTCDFTLQSVLVYLFPPTSDKLSTLVSFHITEINKTNSFWLLSQSVQQLTSLVPVLVKVVHTQLVLCKSFFHAVYSHLLFYIVLFSAVKLA